MFQWKYPNDISTKRVTLIPVSFFRYGYIKSLGIIILMIHLTQTQQIDQEEVLEGDQGGQYTSIDNDDLYAEPRKLKQGQYLYPVIFERSRILD